MGRFRVTVGVVQVSTDGTEVPVEAVTTQFDAERPEVLHRAAQLAYSALENRHNDQRSTTIARL